MLTTGWIALPAALVASITFGQVLAALLAAGWAWDRLHRLWRWPAGVRAPLLGFLGWVGLAALLVRPSPTDLKEALAKWAFMLLLPLAYTQRLDEAAIRRALAVLGGVTLALLPFFVRGYLFSETHRAISLSGGGPNLGSNMMMAALVCAALALRRPERAKRVEGMALGNSTDRPETNGVRWAFVAGTVLFAGVLVLSLNRGAILGAAVGLAWLLSRRWPALLAAGLLAGVLGMAVLPHARPVERLRSVVRWHESFTSQERVHMWVSGQAMVRDRPLLGFTHRRNFIIWYSTRYRDPSVVETVPGHVHNSVLQTAILHGLPGLGLLCWLFAALWRSAGASPSRASEASRGAGAGTLALAGALQPMLLAVLVNAQVDFVVADGQRAMMLYTLSGLLLGTRKK